MAPEAPELESQSSPARGLPPVSLTGRARPETPGPPSSPSPSVHAAGSQTDPPMVSEAPAPRDQRPPVRRTHTAHTRCTGTHTGSHPRTQLLPRSPAVLGLVSSRGSRQLLPQPWKGPWYSLPTPPSLLRRLLLTASRHSSENIRYCCHRDGDVLDDQTAGRWP